MPDKVTVPRIRAMKQKGERIVCITAYDAPTGKLVDEVGVDLILVGDSLGNVVLGYDSTIPVTVREMVHHTKAVRRGVTRALLVSDLPFGSYQASVEHALRSSIALVKAGAEAVKLEGPNDAVAPLVNAGIPVMGHVGLTPQSVNRFGGFKVQGKGEEANEVLDAARRLEDSGAFAIVLELVPAELARRITECLEIPTIGIGAGVSCDGQIQVFHDVVGFSEQVFKHVKPYANARESIATGVERYACEVRSKAFPETKHSF